MTMASASHILPFPHEHTDVLCALHDLSVRSKTRPQLRNFLALSSAVAYEQLPTVDGLERASIGPYEDLAEPAERNVSQQHYNTVAEMILLITMQISQLLVFVKASRERSGWLPKLGITKFRLTEDNPSILPDTLVPVDLGFGLIAAVVAATTSNPTSVATLSLEGVAIDFRLAIELQRVSRDIKVSDGTWARIVLAYRGSPAAFGQG